MIPTILKPGLLPIHCKKGVYSTELKSISGRDDFFSTLTSLASPAKKGSSYGPTEPPHAGLPPKKGYHFYLESLRRGLLARGKSLQNISLNSKDIYILERFLLQCGFSQEGVRSLVGELAKDNHRKEINLSQFFRKATEILPSDGEMLQSVTLEPSAIPYLESALRDLGLTPKEIGHTFDTSRVEGGRLDLNRFVTEIKLLGNTVLVTKGHQSVKVIERLISRSTISQQIASGNQLNLHQNSNPLISKNLQKIGAQIPHKGNDGQISIQDLITALEKITGGSDKGNQLPPAVKATIDQILERVVIANEKNGPQSPLFSFSKLGLTDLHYKEKMGKKGKRVENESLLSPSREKGSISAKSGQQKPESPFPSKEAKLFSDLDAGKAHPLRLSSANRDNGGEGLKGGAKEEGYSATSETRTIDIPQNISSSTFSESINAVKQDLEPIRDFLPSYLINQVGKQISRSILRGERAIRLQLKPPELGALKIEMDMKDNILKIGIITENSSVKELLLSSAHELREALVEQGLKLEKLDVQINHDFGQSLANSKEGLKEGQGRDLNEMPFMAEDDLEGPVSGPWNMVTSDHLLDLVA